MDFELDNASMKGDDEASLHEYMGRFTNWLFFEIRSAEEKTIINFRSHFCHEMCHTAVAYKANGKFFTLFHKNVCERNKSQ